MSWVDTFGGQPANPAETSYRAVALAADQTLQWPWVDQASATYAAKILKVTPSVGSLVITLPSAQQASPGEALLFKNTGSFSYQVKDAAGGAVVTIAAGLAYYINLADNSTDAGVWEYVQFGAGASSADAAALAGKGLIAQTSVLNQNYPVTILVTSYPVVLADRAKLFSVTGTTGGGTLTLPPLTTVGDGFFVLFSNTGTGAWTLDPDGLETIDNTTTATINPGESCEIHAGATGWFTIGKGRSAIFVQTQLSKSVAGAANVTLTTTEAGNIIQKYTGVLTGNIAVIVPMAVAIYFVNNATTGAFTLTVKTAAGAGVVIPQGEKVIVYCDGTIVVDADTVTPPSAGGIVDGAVGAPGLYFTADPDTGIYRPASNQIGFTAGATQIALMDSNGVDVKTGALRVNTVDILAYMMAIG